MTKKYIYFALSCVMLIACNSPQQKHVPGEKKRKVVKGLISNVIDISPDTLILIRGLDLELTTNKGKSWTSIGKKFPTNQIVIDNHNSLWSIYYWGGIHEPRVSMLCKTIDWGKHWEVISFNSFKFFPFKISSNNHEPIRIVTLDHKMYKYIGGSIRDGWEYIDTIGDFGNKISSTYSPQYHFKENNNSQTAVYKTENGKTDTLLFLKDIGTINDMIVIKDTLLVSASGPIDDYGAHPLFVAIVKDRIVKKYNVIGGAIRVFKGVNDRVWVSNYDNLFLKIDTGLLKFY